jgi:DNA-binding winged helix-turn-helix (wHTH) protein/tetratricopeptide (TPR) repeat protein
LNPPGNQIYEFGAFRIDAARRLLLRDGTVVPLTPKAFDTLVVLVENSARVLEKEELMKMLWPDSFVEERNLTVNISSLRKALGESASDHRYIVTVPGRGYRFVADVKELPRGAADLLVERHTRSRITIKDEQTFADNVGDAQALKRGRSTPFLSAENLLRSRVNRAILVASILLIGITGTFAFWRSNHKRVIANTARNQARQDYLSGRSLWNTRRNEDLFKSISYFEQAIKDDSTFALGYAGLADAYAFDMIYWPKAEEMANKALELDNTLGEPHATLGFIRMFWQWNWDDAEREFKQSIDLNPRYATAHQWYAIYIAASLLRFNWAAVEMQKALEIDSSSAPMNGDLGQIYYFAHEYDQAIAACRKALELDPDFINAHLYLYQIYAKKGMYSEAADEFFRYQELVGDKVYSDPANEERLRKAYAANGINGIWRSSIELVRQGYSIDSYSMAEYNALLGANDEALNWLAKAFEARAFALTLVKANPAFEDLHRDPRFQDLLVRAGFATRESFQ